MRPASLKTTMIELFSNGFAHVDINFIVAPRDLFKTSVFLPLPTITALNMAGALVKELTNGEYCLVVTRGYVNWNLWRRLRAQVAGLVFRFFFKENRKDTALLFSSNGHEDGLSVDVTACHINSQAVVKFLPLTNVFISLRRAEKIHQQEEALLMIIDMAMSLAGFTAHPDPRERLQIHYRLVPSTFKD